MTLYKNKKTNLFSGKKLTLFIPLVLLLLAIPLSVLLTGQKQDIRKKASGTGTTNVTLKLCPPDDTTGLCPSESTFRQGETKGYYLIATFPGGTAGEKLDYFKTEINFDKNYLILPTDSDVVTSGSGFDTLFRVDSPQSANDSGKITIELGASAKGSGPSTDQPITIAKIIFQAVSPVSSVQNVTFTDTKTNVVNNTSDRLSLLSAAGFSYTVNPMGEVTPTPGQGCITFPQYDTFDSQNLNTTSLWNLWNSSMSYATQSAQVLQAAVPNGNGYAGVITQKNVCGDFDVNVDFSQFTTSGQSEADVRLSIENQENNSTVFIERFSQGNTQGFHAIKVIDGVETQFDNPISNVSTFGKMRIRRIGSLFTLYYDIGDGWKAFSPANAFASDAKVALIVKSWNQNPTVSASFDNFNLTTAILDPSVTPIPSNTPIPSVTLSPTPPSGNGQYIMDVGEKQSLVFTLNPAINSQIKFNVKLASLRSYPDLYLRLRVKDELAFTNSGYRSVSTDSCNNPISSDRDFYIPVHATGNTYSPVQQISIPAPTGVTVAPVTVDGWVILDGIAPGRYYTFYLKGPKTRRSKMLEHLSLQSSKNSTQDFDWTGKPLDPGDLGDPNNGGKQDCTINSTDWSLLKSRLGTNDQKEINICDLNYDGFCNSLDSIAILDTLAIRPDDDQ